MRGWEEGPWGGAGTRPREDQAGVAGRDGPPLPRARAVRGNQTRSHW